MKKKFYRLKRGSIIRLSLVFLIALGLIIASIISYLLYSDIHDLYLVYLLMILVVEPIFIIASGTIYKQENRNLAFNVFRKVFKEYKELNLNNMEYFNPYQITLLGVNVGSTFKTSNQIIGKIGGVEINCYTLDFKEPESDVKKCARIYEFSFEKSIDGFDIEKINNDLVKYNISNHYKKIMDNHLYFAFETEILLNPNSSLDPMRYLTYEQYIQRFEKELELFKEIINNF